jgi:hypothetical protein
MKQGALARGLIILFCIALPYAYADDKTVNLESRVVISFDKNETLTDVNGEAVHWVWKNATTARERYSSKFRAEGMPILSMANAWPIALHGSNPKNRDDLQALGMRFAFDRKEYNWVDIVPLKGDDLPTEIPLPGRVQQMDMWVWGSNYDYYLEVYVRDYKGVVHIIPMGELRFEGWRNLRVNVPNNIPQSKRYLPKRESLSLVKFRIWTRPTEKVDNFYTFFDHFKVLTDTFEALYDGDDLADPEALSEIFKTETR